MVLVRMFEASCACCRWFTCCIAAGAGGVRAEMRLLAPPSFRLDACIDAQVFISPQSRISGSAEADLTKTQSMRHFWDLVHKIACNE